jgi:FAD/FMN-containing dehydrogenase
MTGDLAAFAREIGVAGPVCVVGGRTQWLAGGRVADDVREVRAPAGIRELEAAEMTVRVGAGTPVAELDEALARVGQWVTLPDRPVGAHGRPVRAGGPTVKTVSGYDLCRLFVGSLGTLALIGEVVLRTRPRPEASVWLTGDADPFVVLASLHRPTSVLWDGERTWALVEGVGPAVADQRRTAARLGLADEVGGPPELPPHRVSVAPAVVRTPAPGWGRFVAEVGVGMVHASSAPHVGAADPALVDLNRRLKSRFDPSGRLNPGRSPLAAG